MPPAQVLCECGRYVADSQWEKHREGQDHKFKMAEKRAHARGHYYFVSDEMAFALKRMGLTLHLSQVNDERTNATNANRHWKTSEAVLSVVTRFASRTDDRPEATLHAALVFASVYGDDTPKILIGMIDEEIQSGTIAARGERSAPVATRESALVALLRANGVRSPALALTNLMPHLLSIAIAELPECAK